MPKIYVNGVIREMTAEEVAEMNREKEEREREYWTNTPYEEAVNDEIRKRYSASAEFAILRQRDAKPEEYNEYYNYCEDRKTYVREMLELYTT